MNDHIQNVGTIVIGLAALAGFVWLMTLAAQCQTANDIRRDERQLECIKQHIYCGEVRP